MAGSRRRATQFLGAPLLSLCVACSSLGTAAEIEEQTGNLAACRGSATDDEVADNIFITEEYGSGLATDLTLTWTPILYALDFGILLAQTLGGSINGSPPPDWSFDAGVYGYGSEAARIELRVFTSVDSGYGPAGTPVTEDVFSFDSYLVGAVVEDDPASDDVIVTYDQPGPLVELLGLGPTPDNPLRLSAAQRSTIVDELSTLAVEPDLIAFGVVDGGNGETTVEHHTRAPATRISDLAAGTRLSWEMVEVNAFRDLRDQRLSTTVWAVDSGAGDVSGYTTFSVSGGYFPYAGRIDFETMAGFVVAERDLACP